VSRRRVGADFGQKKVVGCVALDFSDRTREAGTEFLGVKFLWLKQWQSFNAKPAKYSKIFLLLSSPYLIQ